MDDLLAVFKALGDPARLRIIEFLYRPDAACCSAEDKVCACDVESLLKLSQPAVSHHMKILTQAGLVSAEKEGRWVYYRLNRRRFRELSQHLAQFGKADTAAKSPSRRAAA